MTDMIFESSSLKVELLKFVELKNSTGKNNTNNERKKTIKNQNSASPDQAVKVLLSLLTVIRRYTENPKNKEPVVYKYILKIDLTLLN